MIWKLTGRGRGKRGKLSRKRAGRSCCQREDHRSFALFPVSEPNLTTEMNRFSSTRFPCLVEPDWTSYFVRKPQALLLIPLTDPFSSSRFESFDQYFDGEEHKNYQFDLYVRLRRLGEVGNGRNHSSQ